MKIENIINKHLNKFKDHPFIQKANNNELAKEQLINWLMCAGRESRTFPEIIKNMIEWTNNQVIKDILIENLNDEYGNGNPNEAHFMHYIQLLEQIELSQNDFLNYDEKAGVKFAVSLAYNISMSKDIGLVLGYMLINEALTPIVYSAIQEAMKKYYPELETNFFDLHIKVDEQHVKELYKAISVLDDNSIESLKFGIELGQRGMLIILDESLGIFNLVDNIPEFTINIKE